MTREDKLYTMKMVDLVNVAEKLGIKINKKGSKDVAIQKILEAEHMIDATNKETEKQEEEVKDQVAAEAETKEQVQAAENQVLAPKRGQLIEYDGKAQNICAWAKELGISANTLYGRLYKMGWTVERAFTTKGK